MKVFVNVDGLSEPVNPGGTATFGFIIRDESGNVLAEAYGVVGAGAKMSNNVAEYAALCEALRFLENSKMTQSTIHVRSDSRLVVNQMTGIWKSHKGLYEQKYSEAKELVKRFPNLSFKWVPREENEEADALSREAYFKRNEQQ